MTIKRFIQYLVIFLALFLLYQCAGTSSKSVYVKDGKEYGKVQGSFRHRWWNYYERGISFSDGSFFKEAIEDFRAAVDQRDKDQRMARTYGMHFVDYFPHRELGIVYYETGNLIQAKEELEFSLESFPSAKAYFYLDRVRKALIEQSKISVALPNLVLDFKTREIWTKDDPVIVSGTAKDENYVAEVMVKGIPIFLESAQKILTFEKSLNLVQGKHLVKVSAENLLGKRIEQSITIRVDREGPVLTLDRLDLEETISGRKVSVSGWIHDDAGVADLSINGHSYPIKKGMANVPFKVETTIQKDTLELTTLDELENKTTASIELDFMATGRRPQVLVASADSWPQNLLIAGLSGGESKDLRPPVITLKDWPDTQVVFLENAYIEGRVSDENNIRNLSVNKVPIPVRKGRYIFFGHMKKLVEGKNLLTIEAEDQFGNIAQKTIIIVRKISVAKKLKERLSMTVCPFEQKGMVSNNSLSFQDNLVNAFVNQKRFRMVERTRLDSILVEQKLSQIDLFDQSTALKLGGLIGAQTIISGSIIETRKGIEVVSRLIDTETSDILSTQDVYSEKKDLVALNHMARGMTAKFYRDFPLTDGQVLTIKGRSISTDLGGDVIKLQRRVIIFRDEPATKTSTGRLIGTENKILGYARVIQVMPGVSKVEMFDGKSDSIKPLDKVIIQ